MDEPIELLRHPPADRTPGQLHHHYEVERALAARLMDSTRDERRAIYSTMYEELFREVPDHPRLTRREDPDRTRRANRQKLRLIRPYLNNGCTVAEMGAGDCRFAAELARLSEHVYAIDIADQSGGKADHLDNLEIVVYDGYTLPLPNECVDLVISDQLLEHLHPDDIGIHLGMIHRVLRPGGVYIIRTPHLYTGPHDISMYFSNVPRGFHLKEWTYGELFEELRRAGFDRVQPRRSIRGWHLQSALRPIRLMERLLGSVHDAGVRRRLASLALKEVLVAAYK